MLHRMTPGDRVRSMRVQPRQHLRPGASGSSTACASAVGRIVNVPRSTAKANGPTDYSAAKAGVIGFTRALALGERPKGSHGQLHSAWIYRHRRWCEPSRERCSSSIVAQIPVGRLGGAEEIAKCVAFLASDDYPAFITGATMTGRGPVCSTRKLVLYRHPGNTKGVMREYPANTGAL